jgi:hypothetical protein
VQDPCENALRFAHAKVPQSLELHTGFMNSNLKLNAAEPFCHFQLKLRVVEHRTKPGLLWDREYPERPIYNETLELRVGDADPQLPGDEVQYRWLSDATDGDWQLLTPEAPGMFQLPLRPAHAFSAQLHLTAVSWGQD